MRKIMMIFGTRPEAIKMAPVYLELRKKQGIKVILCVTGQHREMLSQVLDLYSIEPDYNLNVMQSGQDLFDVTSQVLMGLRPILQAVTPSLVLVHGDTTTTFSASLACFYLNVPVGHVEAGLRTNNLKSPFPEEANRQLTARLSAYHFAPTQPARDALLREGLDEKRILVTGNTVIDALFFTIAKIKSNQHLKKEICNALRKKLGFDFETDKFVLITGHRRENFGSGFSAIFKAIRLAAQNNPSCKFVYPLHLNPNVREPAIEALSALENVKLISPLVYDEFSYLMSCCYVVLTDSGGIQEEAPSLGKPVLVMRENTERPEAVEAGTVKIVGTSSDTIVASLEELLTDEVTYERMAGAHNPYGDGTASSKIANFVEALEL